MILFGKNSANYKFAFAKSLLELVDEERTRISLNQLAESFSRNILEHLRENDKQGNAATYLSIDGATHTCKPESKIMIRFR